MKPAGKISILFRSLGPGLLFAGAAIGGSHLVQSTRAGANYGLSLLAVVIFINILKYPFFQYAHRYVAATGESLLDGYHRLGRLTLGIFFILVVFSAIFNVAGITLITTGLATNLLGLDFLSNNLVAALVATLTLLVLFFGKYALLGKLMKYIVSVLAVVTIVTVVIAWQNPTEHVAKFVAPELWNRVGFGFIIALMGWMPAPIDVTVWQSLWANAKAKNLGFNPSLKEALLDFKIGYIGTAFLAICFLTLGALVIYGSGEDLSPKGVIFAEQLISLYTSSIGTWAYLLIAIAAVTTMFSTTLTCLDAYPRVMKPLTLALFPKVKLLKSKFDWSTWFWIILVASGALILMSVLSSSMRTMVDIATTLSFVTAPILAFLNYKVVTGKEMPTEARPKPWLKVYAQIGIIFLTAFTVFYLIWKFVV